MWKILSYLKKHLVVFIPVFMLGGLAVGLKSDVGLFKGLILPITVLMVLPMMVALPFRNLFSNCSGKLLISVLLVNFFILPGVGYSLGKLFLADPVGRLGLLIVAVIPTSGMTISWTAFAGGDKSAAVRLSLVSLLIAALLLPLYISLFLGSSIPVDSGKIFSQVVYILLIPLFVGFLLQKVVLRSKGDEYFQEKVKSRLPLISTAALLLIIFIATALKAKAIVSKPGDLLKLLPPILIFYTLTFFISTFIAKIWLPKTDGVALVYSTGLRNLSLALAIALTAFGKAGYGAAILITVAYLVQIQGAAWYHRFVVSGKIHPGKGTLSQ